MISKILDHYFTEKLIALVKLYLTMKFNADWNISKNEFGQISVRVKLRKLNDEYYDDVFAFYPAEAVTLLCDRERVEKCITEKYKRIIKHQEELE